MGVGNSQKDLSMYTKQKSHYPLANHHAIHL